MTAQPNTEEMERETLRARHQVRLVSEAEEGSALHRLPGGVYGFTYAPAEDALPVFRKHTFQSFEAHKLPDGAERLVGYVSAPDAAAIEAWKAGTEIQFYPAPHGEARTLASVPLDEITPSRKGPSRSDGNFLTLHLGRA